GAIKHIAGGVELFPLFREDSHLRVHELDNVIMTDRQRMCGRIAQLRGSLRSLEALAKAVETDEQGRGGALALFGLFDRCGGERCLTGGDCKRRSCFRRDGVLVTWGSCQERRRNVLGNGGMYRDVAPFEPAAY